MVDCQLRTFDVTDIALLDAFDAVPRERFMPDGQAATVKPPGDAVVVDRRPKGKDPGGTAHGGAPCSTTRKRAASWSIASSGRST
jgi:hypothetical protein